MTDYLVSSNMSETNQVTSAQMPSCFDVGHEYMYNSPVELESTSPM